MRTPAANDRWVTAASVAVAVFASALPVSWLLFFAASFGDGTVVVAWVLTAVFVALHIGHVRYGLRDQAPPYGRWTFAVMLAVMVAGELVVGPMWTPLFASLAASALLVFRPPWSVLVAVAIVLSCLFLGDASLGVGGPYVTMLVAFRSVTLFTLVWFVAGARRLRRARGALADRAVARERARVDAALLGTLTVELDRIETRARSADAALGSGDTEAARAELERMTGGARATLATARSAVAGLRDGGSREELLAAARLLGGLDGGEA
jgi:two-component system sensor histidine kinase DesK